MYRLKESSKKMVEKILGKPYQDIVDMELDEEISYIEHKNKTRLVFSTKADSRKVGRGSPLLSRRRFKTIDEVNKRLARIK